MIFIQATASANRKQIAKAFCSIAELYMTDLCYEDDAERQCESAILHAFEIDGESLDGNLALASLRLSQNRAEEASRIMEVVYTRVKRIKDIMKSRTVIAEISGAPDEVEQTGAGCLFIMRKFCLDHYCEFTTMTLLFRCPRIRLLYQHSKIPNRVCCSKSCSRRGERKQLQLTFIFSIPISLL